MIELELKLSSFLQEAAVPLLEAILAELSGQDSLDERRYAPPPDDLELRETWLENLREDHHSDLAATRRLVTHAAFGSEDPVQIEAEEAEAALRGLTAVRLQIHQKHLADVPDAVLEEGNLEFEELLPDQQQGYLGYFVAAAVQERIVGALGV